MGKKTRWTPLNAFQVTHTHQEGALRRDAFHQLIRYERMRADRTKSRFCLVFIEIDFDAVTLYTFRRFLATIFMNMRITDYAGWHSDSKIGILLPDTTISGAQSFIKNVHDSTADFKLVKSVGLSMYPRISNITMVVDDDEEEPEYYSTYDAKLADMFCKKPPRWKRFLDIFVSVLGLIAAFPLFLLIPLYIICVSSGPIFQHEERVGLGGRIIKILKFRTVKVNEKKEEVGNDLLNFIRDGNTPMGTDYWDSRLIPGGGILRSMGLDEIPQLFNVLGGDMSLVGPRPCLPDEAELYLHWHKKRFDIVPGLTGSWQVGGKHSLTFKEMIRLDIRYGENLSFWKDLGIILKTVPVMIGHFISYVHQRRKQMHSEETESSD